MDEQTLREEREKDELRSGLTPDASLPPGARQFPCRNCGGALTYVPGTTHLKCPYCGTENDIPVDGEDDAHLREHDFLRALEEEERQRSGETGPSADAVKCGFCGAATTVTERRSADLCPYCGHPLTMQNLFKLRLNVQAVLPFAVDADKALAIYQGWLGSLWFAPGDFKRRATRGEAMKGVYMPYFTYDASTRTWYTGQRGDAYYVTEMVPVRGPDGKTSMRPQQVRRVRWTPVGGDVGVAFDDVLVPASQSVPMKIQYGLQPWELGKLMPFRQEFLSGFVTETYQTPLREGFEEAKRLMEPRIDSAVEQDIGGDEQRVSSKRTEYSKVTFKHILLPVWLSAYAYGGKSYRFTVNAQTGEVSGERPYSVWKIAGAILAGLAALALAFRFMG